MSKWTEHRMSQWAERSTGEAVKALSDYANHGGRPQDFAVMVMREHRTIQQSMFGLFLGCIDAWAADDFGHDLRNEFTVKKSQEIVELLGKYNLRPPLV